MTRLQDEKFPLKLGTNGNGTKKRVSNPNRPLRKGEKAFVLGMQQTDPNVFGGKNVEELTKEDFVKGGGRKERIGQQGFIGIGIAGILGGVGNIIKQKIRKI